MVNYEVVGITKTASLYNFEIQVEGFVKSFHIVMGADMYNQMTSDRIKDHITSIVNSRYSNVVITTEDNLKLDAILGPSKT